MRTQLLKWSNDDPNWRTVLDNQVENPDLVFVFGSRKAVGSPDRFEELRSLFPEAIIALSSTAGEILQNEVSDDTITATAIRFESTTVASSQVDLNIVSDSFEAGKTLASSFPHEGLNHVFVLSDGLNINGSALVEGMESVFHSQVSITGGLAGDAADFKQTLVGLNEPPKEKQLVAIGFYGDRLKVGYGSVGGWDVFGPVRRVTKSDANVLYELDGKPALQLYKEYLGEKAAELPASGLLFPLSVQREGARSEATVRTLLSISEEDQSMTFAGDMPEGSLTRLMNASFDNLVMGAEDATHHALDVKAAKHADLAILVSCVGRKLVMGQMIDDEIEAIRDILGEETAITGFYSYGELAPVKQDEPCYLHNQTMTVTLMSEES